MSFDNIIHKIKLAMIHENVNQNKSAFNSSSFDYYEYVSNKFDSNFSKLHGLASKYQFANWTFQHQEYFENRSMEWKIIITFLYSLIVIVSFFGNSIVCKIVFGNSSMRSRTNIYIGNLSISDILMTVLNVPLQLTRILSQNWPLGQFLCRCLPFFQSLSVNVSSFTMAFIALDRYDAIAYPLKPRSSMRSVLFKILFIWGIATMVSSPYPAIADVEESITYNTVLRCRLIYPKPQYQFRQFLTLITLFIQYLIPLCITGITYFRICCILWHRRNIGMISEEQRIKRYVSKWKTIKMLIVVFLVFTVCWCPLNVYHLYQDFRGATGHNKHNSLIFLICHWFAMSSVCYNPFLYCWLNDKFKNVAKSYMQCFLKLIPSHPEISSNSNLINNILKRKAIKQPSKTSIFSSSLNYQNTNKSVLESQNCESIHYNSPNKSNVKVGLTLSDFEMKEQGININFSWETIHLLMNAKETTL